MALESQIYRNVVNANNRQGVAYQKASVAGNPIGYFQELKTLLPETLRSSSNQTRNIQFDIPGGFGSSPGPYGLAGSPTLNALSSPPIIGPTTYAGI